MASERDTRAAEDAIAAFLRAVGAPVDSDPELRETHRRVVEAYTGDLLAGYAEDPAAILADTTSTSAPGLVLLRRVQTSTLCPHHLMPATGVVHVGYFPGNRVVGLGALVRLVHCFAKRLSLQEDLGEHVAAALVTHLGARGAGCVVDFESTCVTARGERAHGARTTSHAWAGELREGGALRAEFLQALSAA
ncbi:MAG: GTP cyclohydrolase I [Polyangiales bacterium]|nr:GTP cyclohydrolase I [Myxococcales bacterium]